MPRLKPPASLSPSLFAAARAYGLTPTSITPLSRHTHRLQSPDGDYILHVHDPHATADHLTFARRWATHVLPEVSVPIPLPLPADPPRIGRRLVEIQPYLPHAHADGGIVPPSSWLQAAELLGKLHRLALPLTPDAPRDLPFGNHPSLPLLQHLADRAARNVADDEESADSLHLATRLLRHATEAIAPRRQWMPHGIVHGDFHFWNILYAADHAPLAIVGFDYLQHGPFIYDVAYASIWINTWQRERAGEWRNLLPRFLTAYESARQDPLTPGERGVLPWAAALSHLLLFFQRLQSSWKPLPQALPDLHDAIDLTHHLPR